MSIHPGKYIRDELTERGWTQTHLAELTGRSMTVINEICQGHKGISAQTAVDLAMAFGTSAQLWMNLDSAWKIAREIERRATA